ncbi:hypothetical protein M0R45_027114 [Rubus argutus]|uniref:Uncharacterized protein n=1 Tax=Rubus argutus TaxID=59490 RepID=A0AAW1X048_RUBAR
MLGSRIPAFKPPKFDHSIRQKFFKKSRAKPVKLKNLGSGGVGGQGGVGMGFNRGGRGHGGARAGKDRGSGATWDFGADLVVEGYEYQS